VAIGASVQIVDAWKTLVGVAQTDFEDSELARQASKAATLESNQSIREARVATAEIVRLIRNKALSTGDPGVYALAEIPAPVPASELPPPGAPTDLRAILNDDGTLTIRWKTSNAKGVTGVVYTVRRRVGFGTGAPFEIVGIIGGSSFLDDSVPTPPASSPVVQYTVQGHRGTTAGATSSVFSVFMGIGSGGGQFILRTSEGESGDMTFDTASKAA
jgi:hypothetical protein